MKKAYASRCQAALLVSFCLQWWLTILFSTKRSSTCGEKDLIISVCLGGQTRLLMVLVSTVAASEFYLEGKAKGYGEDWVVQGKLAHDGAETELQYLT